MKILTCDTQIQRELFDYSEGVLVRFRDDTKAMDEADKAIDAILGSSSNIRMELIIWNRKLNQMLKE